MGTSLGDKIVIVIALLLLGGRCGCERRVSCNYPRCTISLDPVGLTVVIN